MWCGIKIRFDLDLLDFINMNYVNDVFEFLIMSMLDEGVISFLLVFYLKSGKYEGDLKKERVVKVVLLGVKKV